MGDHKEAVSASVETSSDGETRDHSWRRPDCYARIYVPAPMSRRELEVELDPVSFSAVMQFFNKNPRKTLCKFTKAGFQVRKIGSKYTVTSNT